MTVLSTDPPYSQYTGSGDRVFYEYGFEWSYEQVYVEVDGVPVTFTRQQNGVVLDVPPPVGSLIVIWRRTDITQLTDFVAFESFDGRKTEDAVDKLILLKQEAAAWRANLNLVANHQLYYVEITTNFGGSPQITLWNEGESGVFAGEVTTMMPNTGTIVAKPEDFVYFQYGDVEILTEILTSTLYPIEAVEKLTFTCDLDDGYMIPISLDEVDHTPSVIGGEIREVLLTENLPPDEVDSEPSIIGGELRDVLLTENLPPDEVDSAPTLISGNLVPKLVTTYCPDEKLAMTCDLDPAGCSMTPV